MEIIKDFENDNYRTHWGYGYAPNLFSRDGFNDNRRNDNRHAGSRPHPIRSPTARCIVCHPDLLLMGTDLSGDTATDQTALGPRRQVVHYVSNPFMVNIKDLVRKRLHGKSVSQNQRMPDSRKLQPYNEFPQSSAGPYNMPNPNNQLFPQPPYSPLAPPFDIPTMTMQSPESIFNIVEHQMNNIMGNLNSFFSQDPMRSFMQPSHGIFHPNMPPMMPTNDPNAKTYMMSSSQTMEYSNVDGKKKLVQSHDEREMGPNGVWRSRRAHRDTSKGIEQMQEGLFLGDSGEIRERYRNPQTGQLEDRIYHRNVPEQHKVNFVNEWNRRAEEAKRMFTQPGAFALPPNSQNNFQPLPYQ